MKFRTLFVALLALAAAPGAALAQSGEAYSFNSGIKLRGNFHYNRSAVDASSPDFKQAEAGYGVGVEIVGKHLGLGLYGYSVGASASFDSESTPVNTVLEANYYFPVEQMRLAPYVGVHTGLGTYTKEYLDAPTMPKPQDGPRDLGFQAGVRFKPLPLIGMDLQWRQQSASSVEAAPTMERTQILLGVTLF